MNELNNLIKELEHEPPESLARQRLRLLEEATSRQPRRERVPLTDRSAREPSPTPGWPRPTGRRHLLTGALAGVAIATSLTVPILTGSAAPAYAVSKNADGTISVQINEFKDPEKLKTDLHALGVQAAVNYLSQGMWCKEPRARYRPDEETARVSKWNSGPDGAISFTLYPDHIRRGQTLVVTAAFNDPDDGGSVGLRLAEGPVGVCQPVDGNAAVFTPE